MSSVTQALADAEKHPGGTWVLFGEDHKHPLELSVRELGIALRESECRIVLQPDMMNHVSTSQLRYRVRLMEEGLGEIIDLLSLLKDFGAEADPSSDAGSVKIPVEHSAAAVEVLERCLG